ncbi:hypothetical protein DFH06DRAFT_1320562 [Mycena polygramma]|nr:hypothetical protein DFH06DRAFT_1320562 [Mycena polygramma]
MADRKKRTPASTSSLSLRYSILTTSPDSKSKSTSASQTQNVVDAPSRKRKSENNQEEGRAKKKQSTDDATRYLQESELSDLTEILSDEEESEDTVPYSTDSPTEPSSLTLSSEPSQDRLSADQEPVPQIPHIPRIMAPKSLPMRGSKSAPSFDGKPGHLERYLRDVRETGEDTERTSDDELIDIALRYLDIDDEELWKRKRTANMTFDAFKKEIMKLYPGSNGDKLYAWSDLREVVRKGQERPPSNKDDFGEYQRNFTRIADFLKSKDKISERERDEQFMRGIHADFRFRVLQRLQIVKPSQASDTPYGIEDVIEAAEWAIDGTPGQFYESTEEDTTVIKKEMVEITASMREMRTALAGLSRQVEFPRQRQPEPRAAYQNQQQDRGPYLRNQEQGRWNTEKPETAGAAGTGIPGSTSSNGQPDAWARRGV